MESIYIADSTLHHTTHSIIVGAPEGESTVNGSNVAIGAVYHYGIGLGPGPATIELGRMIAPAHRLGSDMKWGHALAVVQEGDGYGGVQVGISAPGAADGKGLVYAWRPFTSSGGFSTSGASLTAPSNTGRRYGEVLQAVSFLVFESTTQRLGFIISAPKGLFGEFSSGFVQARINQQAMASQTWKSDRQRLTQSTTGDHLPDQIQ